MEHHLARHTRQRVVHRHADSDPARLLAGHRKPRLAVSALALGLGLSPPTLIAFVVDVYLY